MRNTGAVVRWRTALFVATAVAVATACGGGAPQSGPAPAEGADIIYSGGDIVTMEGDQPTTAEAVVVDDGRIVFVGNKADALTRRGAGTVMKDLAGRTLMPGFIDGHAHAQQFGTQAVGANLLAPPDGGVNTIDDVVARLIAFRDSPDAKLSNWVFGVGYDDALLGRHPTRQDLDKVSTTRPVMAGHISGHFAAVNTAGLKLIGYDASTPNPEGGVIRRESDGKTPNGVLEELAAIPPMLEGLTPKDPAIKDEFLKRGLQMAKSYGYTTATEGRMFGAMHQDMVNAAARGLVDIDFTGWMDYSGRSALDGGFATTYTNHYRLAGLKVTLDGSPQGRTAWRTVPYLLPPDGQKPGYKGYPAIPDTKQVEAYLDEAYTKGWPVKVHANGDAAIDQMFAALKPVVARHGVKPGQATLIHGQFIRPDQVQELKALGIFPSMFPMHTFYWGDWYTKIVGQDIGARISPMRSILNTGLHATSHTDAPVALPNLMQVVWATVNRTSRSGAIIGPDERVSPYEAMKMVTIWGAEQFGEQETQGLHHGGQTGRLRGARQEPDHRRPDDHQHHHRDGDDQGRKDRLHAVGNRRDLLLTCHRPVDGAAHRSGRARDGVTLDGALHVVGHRPAGGSVTLEGERDVVALDRAVLDGPHATAAEVELPGERLPVGLQVDGCVHRAHGAAHGELPRAVGRRLGPCDGRNGDDQGSQNASHDDVLGSGVRQWIRRASLTPPDVRRSRAARLSPPAAPARACSRGASNSPPWLPRALSDPGRQLALRHITGSQRNEPGHDIGICRIEGIPVDSQERHHRKEADALVAVPVRMVANETEGICGGQLRHVRGLGVMPLLLRPGQRRLEYVLIANTGKPPVFAELIAVDGVDARTVRASAVRAAA